MIKYLCQVLALHAFIVGAAALVLINDAFADGVVGVSMTIKSIPSLREDGSPLTSQEIKAIRAFKVGPDGLEALSPDILYNQEDEVSGTVFMSVDTAEGTVDLCARTIDTFDRMSAICSDAVSMTFKVAPPAAPGGVTFTQAFSINIMLEN